MRVMFASTNHSSAKGNEVRNVDTIYVFSNLNARHRIFACSTRLAPLVLGNVKFMHDEEMLCMEGSPDGRVSRPTVARLRLSDRLATRFEGKSRRSGLVRSGGQSRVVVNVEHSHRGKRS